MKIPTTIGVDWHKCRLNTVVLDQDGRIVECREIATKCRKQIGQYFGSYGDRAQVAVESVGFYQWFWDSLRRALGSSASLAPDRGQPNFQFTGNIDERPGGEAACCAVAKKFHTFTDPVGHRHRLFNVHR